MVIRKIEIETVMKNMDHEETDDWLVYGHSDIFKTQIISNDFDIKALYSDSLNYDNHFKQVWYLHNKNNEEEDNLFWENSKLSNFSALYFVTLDYDHTDNQRKNLNDIDDIEIPLDKMQFYDILNNYDNVIVCHGDSPNDIDKDINDILNKYASKQVFVKNIYKLFMTHYSKMNNNEKIIHKNISAQIQIVLKTSGNLVALLTDIKKQIPNLNDNDIKQISGSNQLNININSIDVHHLFLLYKVEKNYTGIFSLKSQYRNDIIQTTRLKFLMTLDENISYFRRTNLIDLSEKFSKNVNQFKKLDKRMSEFYKAQLDRIVSSMKHILESNLPDYSFLAIYPSLLKFMDKVESNVHYSQRDDCTRYYLEAAREIINMSEETQIGYYSMQSYICKEVIAPSELISFYSAFLWEFNKLISKMQNDYQEKFTFCLKPSLKTNVQIKGLFLDDKKINDRLLLVYIPIKYFYSPQVMLFSLCHEGGHYVGEKIRCREQRAEYINNAYSYYLIDTLCENIDYRLIEEYAIRKKILDRFNKYVMYYSHKMNSSKYSKDLEEIITNATKLLLFDLAFEIIQVFNFSFKENDKDYIKKINDINLIFKIIRTNSKNMLIVSTYPQVIQDIIYVFLEAFSDKLARMVLDISDKEYVVIILESYGVKSISEVKEDFIILRMLANFYSDNDEVAISEGTIGNYVNIYSDYIKSNEGSNFLTLPSIFKNPAMLKCLIDYLKCCSNEWKKYDTDFDEFKKLREPLVNNLSFNNIREFNKEYRTDIYNIINKNENKTTTKS